MASTPASASYAYQNGQRHAPMARSTPSYGPHIAAMSAAGLHQGHYSTGPPQPDYYGIDHQAPTSAMQARAIPHDLYAMQQHLALNPAATATTQPGGSPVINGVYHAGMIGRPSSQQSMQRVRQAPAPAQSPTPRPTPSTSYYPAPSPVATSSTPQQQQQMYYQQTAQAQAAAAAAHVLNQSQQGGMTIAQQRYMPPQAGPSRAPAQTPQPQQQQVRPTPPSRQPSTSQQPMTPNTAQQQAMQLQAQQTAAMAHQQAQRMHAGTAQQQAAAAAATAAARAGPSYVHSPGGVAMMRLLQYSDLLSSAMQVGTLEALQHFVSEYFTENASSIYSLYDPNTDQTKHFEIPACAIPRFLLTLAESGVRGLVYAYDSPREYQQVTGPSSIVVGYQVECPRVTYITTFSNGTQVSSAGQQRARFTRCPRPPHQTAGLSQQEINALPPLLKLEQVEYVMTSHQQSIIRDHIIFRSNEEMLSKAETEGDEVGSQGSSSKGKGKSRTSVIKGEPNGDGLPPAPTDEAMSEGGARSSTGSKAASNPALLPTAYRTILPEMLTGPFGLTERSLRCLEIAESVAQLRPLIMFSLQNQLGPLESLHRYTTEIASKNESARRYLLGEDHPSAQNAPTPQQQQQHYAPPTTPHMNGFTPTASHSGTKRKAPPLNDARSPMEDLAIGLGGTPGAEVESPPKAIQGSAGGGRGRAKSLKSLG